MQRKSPINSHAHAWTLTEQERRQAVATTALEQVLLRKELNREGHRQGQRVHGFPDGLLDPITQTLAHSADNEDLHRRIDVIYDRLDADRCGLDFYRLQHGLKHLHLYGSSAIHITEDDFAVITDKGALLGPTGVLGKAQFRTMMKAELAGLVKREQWALLELSQREQRPHRSMLIALMCSERLLSTKMDQIISHASACDPHPGMRAAEHALTRQEAEGPVRMTDDMLLTSSPCSPRGTSRSAARQSGGDEVRGETSYDEASGQSLLLNSGGVARCEGEAEVRCFERDSSTGLVEELLKDRRASMDSVTADIALELREQRGMQARFQERLVAVESLVLGSETCHQQQEKRAEGEVKIWEEWGGEASLTGGNDAKRRGGTSDGSMGRLEGDQYGRGDGAEGEGGLGLQSKLVPSEASAGQQSMPAGSAEGERILDEGYRAGRIVACPPCAGDAILTVQEDRSNAAEEGERGRAAGPGSKAAGEVWKPRGRSTSTGGAVGHSAGPPHDGEAGMNGDGSGEGRRWGLPTKGIRWHSPATPSLAGSIDTHQVLKREHDEVILMHCSPSAAQTRIRERDRWFERARECMYLFWRVTGRRPREADASRVAW